MVKSLLCFFSIVICLAAGCSDQKQTKTPPPPLETAQSAEATLQSAPEPPVPPLPPSTQAADTAPPAASEPFDPGQVPSLQEVNDAFQAWYMSRLTTPKDVQELVKAGLLKAPPQPPPGKKFLFDAKGMRVILVNQN